MRRSIRQVQKLPQGLLRGAPRSTACFAGVKSCGLAQRVVPKRLMHLQNGAWLNREGKRDVGFRGFASQADTFTVNVPQMGDSISEGTVVEWLKAPGDHVEVDDVLVVLETDKVSVDVRATEAGVVVELLAKVEDTVNVGAPLVILKPGVASSVSSSIAPAERTTTPVSSSSSAVESVVVNVPSMGDSISEGTVTEWLKTSGDFVVTDEVIVVLETDKVSVDVRAPQPGYIGEIFAQLEDVVKIGAPLLSLIPGEAPIGAKSSSKPSPSPAVLTAPTMAVPILASPVAPFKPSIENISSPMAESSPSFALPERGTRREKMSRMRMRIAERLKESQNYAASLTTFQDCDMGNFIALRKEYQDAFEKKHGVKLGFMSVFVKASTAALLEVPAVNAMIDEETQEIVYRDYVDMSVAVATPKGLVTPVLQNTESMSFAEIEKKLAELANRARTGGITLEEMTGGNFTISNGGVYGSLMGTPILNRPQSGILGMHATKMRPVVYKGEIVARPMMYLALTYDHRIVDGREAVTCLKSIANKIENPERLLLDL